MKTQSSSAIPPSAARAPTKIQSASKRPVQPAQQLSNDNLENAYSSRNGSSTKLHEQIVNGKSAKIAIKSAKPAKRLAKTTPKPANHNIDHPATHCLACPLHCAGSIREELDRYQELLEQLD